MITRSSGVTCAARPVAILTIASRLTCSLPIATAKTVSTTINRQRTTNVPINVRAVSRVRVLFGASLFPPLALIVIIVAQAASLRFPQLALLKNLSKLPSCDSPTSLLTTGTAEPATAASFCASWQLAPLLLKHFGVKPSRHLLQPIDYARARTQQQIVVNVKHAARAPGRSLFQTLG